MSIGVKVDFALLNVLLVEDEEFARKLQVAALRQLGIGLIRVVGCGREALELLPGEPPFDIVMSDWNMPNMTGLDLLRAVRERWPRLPFVMLTGLKSLESVERAAEIGVDGYLVKPFSLQQLKEKILLSLERARTPRQE